MTYIPGKPLPFAGPFSGVGPFDLVNNAINIYDDSGGDNFTLNMPANPGNGNEVGVCELGSTDSAVTLSGNGRNVSPWYTVTVIGPSTTLAFAQLVARWKFIAAFNAWKKVDYTIDVEWHPINALGAGGSPHTLTPMQVAKYEGSATLTINLPASPDSGVIAGVSEREGLATGVLTVLANGNNFINTANASVASETFSIAYLQREWRFDSQSTLWLPTRRVN